MLLAISLLTYDTKYWQVRSHLLSQSIKVCTRYISNRQYADLVNNDYNHNPLQKSQCIHKYQEVVVKLVYYRIESVCTALSWQ